MPLNSYSQMVQEYYVQRIRRLFQARTERLRTIHTEADAVAFQQQLEAPVRQLFQPMPERCPLDVQITGTLEGAGFRVEKLHFQSRPGTRVTANLYLPAKVDQPVPAVLVPCGHSHNGKAWPGYQQVCVRLALHGFAALIYDPYNQGERDQYCLLDERADVLNSVCAHNMMGKQLELIGEWFGAWRTWDGMRAADLLCERPEVDASRLGLTGNSGGGTLTTWLWAADPRFTMAAPGCFTTTIEANLENEIPADAEQYPHGLIGAGLERTDFMIMRAPKPLLLLGQAYDFFDRRGLLLAHDELQRFYDLHNAADRLELFIDNGGHGFSTNNQSAMIRFFCKHAGLPCPHLHDAPEPFSDAQVAVTPEGSDIRAGARPIFNLIHDRARQLASERTAPTLAEVRTQLERILALPEPGPTPHYRVLRAVRMADRVMARYAIETEPGILALLKHPVEDPNHSYVLEPPSQISLYVPHISAQADLEQEPWARELLERHLYALDVRGLGESMHELIDEKSFFENYGKDYYYHGHGLMLAESYLGRRLHDLRQSMRLLRDAGATQIDLYGRGQGALLALFAALLDDEPSVVHLHHAPTSYEDWTEAPIVLWPAANFLRGVLTHFDLPDCYRLLGDRLRMTEPWDARMQPIPE